MEFKITEKKPTICLNMIVKNESHIIENTLQKLCNKISFDYWVICDTGSTDNTPQIINNFFLKKEIKGELFYDEWVNFAHNRTLALQRAYKKTDLLLIFDADDEIVGNIVLPSEVLFDEYHLKFGSSLGVSYTRILLINNHKRFQYLSVIHEFINCLEAPIKTSIIDGDYYVISGRSGSRSLDPNKYLKDALILEKAYEEALNKQDQLFNRYAFYCANSYKDCGQYENAIKWYKITLSNEKQWHQEKYVSCLYIFDCLNALNRKEEGFFYLVKSFAYDCERVECLYPLLVHFCCENMHYVAYNYYLNVKDFYENRYLTSNIFNKLFIINDKFNFFVPYYMILIADKVKDFSCVIKMYEIVFIKKQKMFEDWYIKNFLYNLQFFLQYVNHNNKTNFVSLANDYIHFLDDNGVNLHNYDFLHKEEYKNFGINFDKYILKEITFKSQKFSHTECFNSKNILIYTGFSEVDWNYTYTLTNALGGSEKAVAYLSKCFPKDYTIYISGHVENETIDNIHYIHLDKLTNLINEIPFNTVIVSRYISFYEMFPKCSFYQSFIWAHDVVLLPYGTNLSDCSILKKWNKYINAFICLTEWHKNHFLNIYPSIKDKIQIINNGINIDSFKAVTNSKIKNRFIYTSRPDRGLDNLLKLWPKILERIPDATLTISSYGNFPSKPEETILKKIIDENPDTIRYLGKLNTDKLYEEMAYSEYWLYPTHWPETSCITALEMLMSEVICLYYPVAGLTNTLDKYGIQVCSGEEIETIVSLTQEQKENLRTNGRKYAESCSWEARYKIWNNLLFESESHANSESKLIPNYNFQLNIAIYNSFNFHYEMFGFIIYFCKKYNHKLTIFTPTENTIGWLDFYKDFFKDYNFEYKSFLDFKQFKDNFDFIFVTTDDDKCIQSEWINNRYIAIQHTNNVRNHYFTNNLGIRPFVSNYIDWALPCYTILNEYDKINLNEVDAINIAIIGGNNSYNYNIINKLQSSKRINLFIIGRNTLLFKHELLNFNNNNFYVNIHNNIPTNDLLNILKKCDYILTDTNFNTDHINGISMSGSIPLAFSTLTPLIISKQNNEFYKFKNVIEFDYDSVEPIILSLDMINIEDLKKERNELISMFHVHLSNIIETNKNIISIPKKIIQTWEHKDLNPEFQKIVDLWKINNPNYEYYLFDKNERLQFIKENFDEYVIEAYKNIIPGAYKSDLFRYCYLYINGGVYIDIDTLCIGKLDDFLLPNIEFIVPIDLNINHLEGKHNLACGFICSRPKHPILLNCINKIVFHVKNNIIPQSKLDFTGPGLLGRCVNLFLQNGETESFVSKEGINNNIYFLKFEPRTEYIKDNRNNILFQNKNGNNYIIELYKRECDKLSNYVCWVKSNSSDIIQKKKDIAIMIYGQFRNYKKNILKNLNMLNPIIKNYNVHLFILSDKEESGNFSKDNEEHIKNIFLFYGFKIHIFNYIENLNISNDEDNYVEFFLSKINDYSGIENKFVPRLLYRKYILNKLKNDYISNNNIYFDLTIYCRLFDTKITNNLDFENIENEINSLYQDHNIIFGSSDTFFIGSQMAIDYLFNIVKTNLYHNLIWEDNKFIKFVSSMDICLCKNKATYSPEIQYIAHIYYSSNFKYKNIRVDFNNIDSEYNKKALYNIILDPDRKIFTKNNFNLKKDNIEEINKLIPLDFFNYYTHQGYLDYNKGIGEEHYKLLCCISQQIQNGIIIDIGTHHGNSAVSLAYSLTNKSNNLVYSFDIKKMIQDSCIDFFNKYSVKYCLENIFDENIKNKYKHLLLSSSLIMIDIDPHDGILEYEMYLWLKNNNYKGFIIYDDIFLEKGHLANDYLETTNNMIDFWNKIPDNEKIDITHIGHWSGTGIVCFDFNENNFILE